MAALKALFDKKQIAFTRAKLRAWWEGEEFNEEAAIAEIEAKLAADPAANDATESDLFDEPPFDLPPRLKALAHPLGGEPRPALATPPPTN